MASIEQVFQKTLKSFPNIEVELEYEDKLTGIYVIKEGEAFKLRLGILGKKFLESANEEELTGVIAHEFGHITADLEGIAKKEYLSEQDKLEGDMLAESKAVEKGYKKQLLAALELTKRMYNDWTGEIELRIKKLEGKNDKRPI